MVIAIVVLYACIAFAGYSIWELSNAVGKLWLANYLKRQELEDRIAQLEKQHADAPTP